MSNGTLEGAKNFLASKTIIGALITVVASVAALAHYTLSPADQTQIVELLTGIPALVGGLMAIYGRVTATQTIA